MARIRTVKPQLFKHETLYELERETGLPIRLAWIGLFTLADREGRFKWRPRELKADILPYDDDIDFGAILNALASVHLIQRYQVDGEFFGHIPKWHQHQHVNAREAKSTIPGPELATPSEDPVQEQETHVHARALPVHARGEGKGKEGKGKEEEGKELTAAQATAAKVWNQYMIAYASRYGERPVRNAKVNSIIKQLVERLGDEAPEVAEFFVHHNEPFYCKSAHSIGLCLRDAEGLRTQWKTGRKITSGEVRNIERTDNLKSQLQRMKASI